MTLYICRDLDGELFLTHAKPWKQEDKKVWLANDVFIQLPKNNFKTVSWTDDTPTKVKLVVVK